MSGIPVIEHSIMEQLFWAIVPHLITVHPMEDWVLKGRDKLVAHIQAALVPVQEYLAMYEKWVVCACVLLFLCVCVSACVCVCVCV